MNPVRKIEQAIAGLQPRQAYSMIDAVMLNVTLGLFAKAGISAAVLNVEDLDSAVPVRFDAVGGAGAGAQFWPCVQDGKVYFYFDLYQMVAVVVKTSRKRFFSMNRDCYTPFFLTPVAPVLTGASSDDFETALEWIEQRYRRAEEVLPTLLTS